MLGVEVVKNEEGKPGVEKSFLPQHVAYRFHREQVREIGAITKEDLSAAEDAHIALTHTEKDVEPQVVGERLGGNRAPSLIGLGRRRLVGKSEPVESAKCSSGTSVDSAGGTTLRGGKCFSSAAAAPPVKSLVQVVPQPPQESPKLSSAKLPPAPRWASKSLVSEGASDQGGLDGVCDASTKFTNMLRKKLPGPELLQAARQVIAHSSESYSAASMWEE